MDDLFDSEAFAALQGRIKHELHGDGETGGLYRSVVASSNWDDFVRAKGTIYAYEEVLKMMQEIVRKLNEPHRREDPPRRWMGS